MTDLQQAVKFSVEECIRFQVFIPKLTLPDGRVLDIVDKTGAIQGVLPPIDFLVPDPDNGGHIKARFHAMEMRWEIVE